LVKKQKIRDICQVLDDFPRVTYNHLKKIVVEEKGMMSAQTFAKALSEGAETGTIERIDDSYGKLKRVWYSTKPEFSKLENQMYNELTETITFLKQKLVIFQKNFTKFNSQDKGTIIFAFLDWSYAINSKIFVCYGTFRTRKFGKFIKEMASMGLELSALSLIGDEKERGIIWNELMLGWHEIEQDAIEEIDDFLKLKKLELK